MLACLLFGFAPAEHTLASGPVGEAVSHGWNIQRTPNGEANHGILSDVSCVSDTFCIAVGTYRDPAGLKATLTEVWDGRTWKIESAVKPNVYSLTAVSCTAGSFCEALGQGPKGPIAEAWNGVTWQLQPLSHVSIHSRLRAVSCTSMSFCEAVGNGIATTWNGTTWATTSVPHANADLLSVSCPSSSFCMAVGDDQSTAVTEAWNGHNWTLETAAKGSFGTDQLSSVSCTSPSFCQAVGTVTEEWDGRGWSVESRGSWPQVLWGVACPKPTLCQAVGQSASAHALTARWNQAGWSVEAQPSSAFQADGFMSVSCPSPTFCQAVGLANGSIGWGGLLQSGPGPPDMEADPWSWTEFGADFRPLSESWDGASWKIQHTKGLVGDTNNLLESVSCPQVRRCQAVGWSGAGRSIASALGPTGWTRRSTPNPAGSIYRQLYSVSCVSISWCEAVGDNGHEGNLAEVWNGVSWSAQAVPNPSSGFGRLVGVSCASVKFCEAVGYSVGPSGKPDFLPQAEMWNGHRWISQHPPALADSPGQLFGVSCVSSVFCIAVGGSEYFGSSIIEKWDGTNWHLQPYPHGPEEFDQLNAVSCSSTQFCQAVGCSSFEQCGPNGVGYSSPEALAEIWNGSAWQLAPMVNSNAEQLWGVSCSSARFCLAVGDLDLTASPGPATEQWNGTRWSNQKAPRVRGGLMGVSCVRDGLCEAVGFRGGPIVTSTLAVRYRRPPQKG